MTSTSIRFNTLEPKSLTIYTVTLVSLWHCLHYQFSSTLNRQIGVSLLVRVKNRGLPWLEPRLKKNWFSGPAPPCAETPTSTSQHHRCHCQEIFMIEAWINWLSVKYSMLQNTDTKADKWVANRQVITCSAAADLLQAVWWSWTFKSIKPLELFSHYHYHHQHHECVRGKSPDLL